MPELLSVENVKKHFPRGSKLLKAVDGVSFTLQAGETLGLVGESGSGKSTLGRTLLRLIEPNAGRVLFEGEDLAGLTREALRNKRREMQIIFQDPLASLNPQMSIGQAIEDPLVTHKIGTPGTRREKVAELLDLVEIGHEFANSFPYEFSGGQQQRVGIARALALNPKLIVCDEPVSALDVSIQAQVISLLLQLRKRFNLAYLFISHDLGVIRYISDRIAVMYLGRIVQIGPREEVFKNPVHPYTQALIASVPRI
ncbi:MAG TPA: ATP-binding cassette domain-containing protein, partial [Armatimonadota bacterium]|nr:ATP-binding cassette domain-containing protein [Armatimonadota bacterium]